MKEPENLTLRLIRELRDEVATVVANLGKLEGKVDKSRSEVLAEIRGIRKYLMGETIAARYVTVGVEGRLDELEKRVTALEDQT